jgi:hypothetical protein
MIGLIVLALNVEIIIFLYWTSHITTVLHVILLVALCFINFKKYSNVYVLGVIVFWGFTVSLLITRLNVVRYFRLIYDRNNKN